MTATWLNGARRAMLGTICLTALTVSGEALAQDATVAQPVPAEDGAAPADAVTQDQAAQGSDQDIVVTARRRNEVLQDVPIAVTAYSGEQLERQGAVDITDVADTTPNVNLETSRGTNTTLTAFIRGVGQQDPVAGFEQGVGLYIDDVYLNRPQGALLDIYDVERIEILRGPQGTLYGRNTIGGAVKYVTRRLSEVPTAEIKANIGTYKQLDLIGKVSAPINDVLRIGMGAARLTRDGFGENLTTGRENYNKDIFATRGTVELEPSENVFFRLSGDYTWDVSNPRGGHRLIPGLQSGAPILKNVFDTRSGLNDPNQKVKGGGVALHGEIGVNDWLKLRSITAFRKDTTSTAIDFDALPAIDVDVPAIYKNKQFSQEVQAVVERGPLSGVVGAYYLDANAFNVFDVRLYTSAPGLGLTAATRGDVDTKTWAIFGDFSYDVTSQISVSAGLRYTSDKRHARVFRQNLILGGSPELGGVGVFDKPGTPFPTAAASVTSNFDGKRKDTAWTPRFSISYKPNSNHNIYASYSRGFKGGGFDPRGQSTLAPDLDLNGVKSADEIYDFMAFDPETVNSYEIGWKGSTANRRVRWALAAFRADYEDVQVPGSAGQIVNGIPVFTGVTTNAGKARFQGVELETSATLAQDLAAAGDRLNFAGSLGYLDAKYREFIANITFDPDTGLPISPARPYDVAEFAHIQNTPKWTASGGLDYDTPVGGGRLNLNSTLSYRSKSQQFEFPIPGLDQKGFALWDANIVWRAPGNRFTVGLHGKNLANKKYVVSGYNYLSQNLQGEFVGNLTAPLTVPPGQPGYDPTLGREGVLTAFYGNPRQVFLSVGYKF
jgi:iron complex outermembrane recepter protein